MINIITPSLSAALDRRNISDRKSSFSVTNISCYRWNSSKSWTQIEEYSISRSYIKNQREKQRSEISAALKKEFSRNVPLIVHWDGKLKNDISGKEHVDRLPIIVSGCGMSQLLKVSKLSSGAGENQSEALNEWNIQNIIVGMSFDSTSSNTGCHAGACVLLEKKLEEIYYISFSGTISWNLLQHLKFVFHPLQVLTYYFSNDFRKIGIKLIRSITALHYKY